MIRKSNSLSIFAVTATLIAYLSAPGAVRADSSPTAETYGIGVTPAVYLINFLLMYITNPNNAANMPAYRAPIPADLTDCLNEYPLRPWLCPYSDYALSFGDLSPVASAYENESCPLPIQCRSSPEWEALAPAIAEQPQQVNERLGLERANSIAQSLRINKSMILTDVEWQCTLGQPPRDETQRIIASCLSNLTNSNGNTNIPLSSFGLALDDKGDVQSLCAPAAPCLVFNRLFTGKLEKLAASCGWLPKLLDMWRTTPWLSLLVEASSCQQNVGMANQGGACLAETVCN